MEEIILEFTACCRSDGMRISTAEVLDCLRQLELAGSWDEAVFHTILKANFAKSRREQDEFDRLYRLFFHEMKKGRFLPSSGEERSEEELGDLSDSSSEMVDPFAVMADLEKGMGKGLDSDMDQALMDFMKGDPQAFIEAVRQIHDQESQASQAIKSNLGQLTGRL